MDLEKKSLNFIFPSKYVIPKSLSRLAIGQVSTNWDDPPSNLKNWSNLIHLFLLLTPELLMAGLSNIHGWNQV